jgi:N-acetylglucosamine-6-phosphate deacetylase
MLHDMWVPASANNRSLIFTNALLYQCNDSRPTLTTGKSVRVLNGIVADIGPIAPGVHDVIVDMDGRILAPGFIDVQCNGALGIDLLSEPERLWEFAAVLPRWGVTTVLPTLISSPEEVRHRLRTALAHPPEDFAMRTKVAGLHYEGPFLNHKMKGAHPGRQLHASTAEHIANWVAPEVALVTLAPELPGAFQTIEELVSRGVVVSLGHSDADAETVERAFAAGARSVTHLFNAMSPLHHRRPGMVGAALHHPNAFASLICDGQHVAAPVVALAQRLLGERLVLVTDAVSALGLPPGRVKLGDVELHIDEHTVTLADGTLAGSNLSMDIAVQNLMSFSGCDLATAIHAATTAPAALLGRSDIGSLTVGGFADLVELDSRGRLVATWIRGNEAFRSASGSPQPHTLGS